MVTLSKQQPLQEWSEATVRRYLSTYRKNRVPRQALFELGLVNGMELQHYFETKPLGDDYIKEATALAIKDPVECWEHCQVAVLDSSSDLEQALLESNKQDDDEVDGKFPPLCEKPSTTVFVFFTTITLALVLASTLFTEDLADLLGQDSKQEFVTKLWKYASIPIGTTLFTYAHVWAALWLTFYPLEFTPKWAWQLPGTNVGFPIGWQGIIAFKGDEMARMAVRMIKQHLLTVDEVFGKLDADRMAEILHPALAIKMESVLDEVFTEEAPALWRSLPSAVRKEIINTATRDSNQAVKSMLVAMRPEIETLLDLENLVVEVLVGDLNLCVDVFVVCGHKELAFIKNIGAVMGGVLGMMQMLVWFYYKPTWFLPVVGCVAGAITNWLALLLIFWPLEPLNLGCLGTLHGRFLMRQKEVAKAYGKLVNRHVLKVENIVKELLHGKSKHRVEEIVRNSVFATVDDALKPLGPFLGVIPGTMQRVERVKDRISTRINESMYELMMGSEEYMRERFDLEYTLEYRMSRLDYAKFESLLHPIFQAEEWKLVLLGGVVGLLFGLLQVLIIEQ